MKEKNTEIEFAEGVPLSPQIRPVIVVEGSDYDMGYQLNEQLVKIFGRWFLRNVFMRFEKSPNNKQTAILASDKRCIKKYASEMIDFLKGMVDSANDNGVSLSYTQVLASFSGVQPRSESYGMRCSGQEESQCSAFAVWGESTKDGKLIVASTTEHELTFEFTIIGLPTHGNKFIISPYSPTSYGGWGFLGGHPLLNDKGLVYVHHGASQFIENRPRESWTYGVPRFLITLHTLTHANNCTEALDLANHIPSSDSYWGGFWADVSGNAFVCESKENPKVVRRSGDYGERDFLYAANNAISKDLGHCQGVIRGERKVYIPHGGWVDNNPLNISSVHRNLGMWNMLHNYSGQIDLDFAMMMTRFAGNAPSYDNLYVADSEYIRRRGSGWDTKMCNQINAMVGIVIPDKLLYYVSAAGCPGKVAYPFSPNEHYYRVSPLNSFYRLKLCPDSKEILEEARKRAQYNLYEAHHKLVTLNYSDTAYFPLLKMLDKAVIEWQRGRYYREIVIKETKGKESLYNLNKALRAYTRCQAFAEHVYNQFVTPAARPEDLGLRPWFGSWGQWATSGEVGK